MLPKIAPTMGMMRSSVSEVTIVAKAAPMITATARSSTLPLAMKSLNSRIMAIPLLPVRCASRWQSIIEARRCATRRALASCPSVGPPTAHGGNGTSSRPRIRASPRHRLHRLGLPVLQRGDRREHLRSCRPSCRTSSARSAPGSFLCSGCWCWSSLCRSPGWPRISRCRAGRSSTAPPSARPSPSRPAGSIMSPGCTALAANANVLVTYLAVALAAARRADCGAPRRSSPLVGLLDRDQHRRREEGGAAARRADPAQGGAFDRHGDLRAGRRGRIDPGARRTAAALRARGGGSARPLCLRRVRDQRGAGRRDPRSAADHPARPDRHDRRHGACSISSSSSPMSR